VSSKRREVVALLWGCGAAAVVLYAIAIHYGMAASAVRLDALVGADVVGLGVAFGTLLG
jgi:hypothetical protein